MPQRRQPKIMKRLGQMFSNLGNLYGKLYGSGNRGGVIAEDPSRPQAPARPGGSKKRKHKRRSRK